MFSSLFPHWETFFYYKDLFLVSHSFRLRAIADSRYMELRIRNSFVVKLVESLVDGKLFASVHDVKRQIHLADTLE